MEYPLLSLVENPPPGFEYRPGLSRRDVRSSVFALFADSIDAAELRLQGVMSKVTGIIVTFTGEIVWEPRAETLFHLGVPPPLRIHLPRLLPFCLGFLETIRRQADANRKLSLELARAMEDHRRLSSDFDRSRKSLLEEISERRAAEAALRVSEERYRLVVDNASDAIFIAQDGRVKFPNPRLSELSGFSAEEITKEPFVEFIHPEDRETVAGRYAKRLQGEEAPNRYTFRILTKSGAPLWMEIGAVLIAWEGRPATLNFLRDVTQQVNLEAQLLHAQKMEAVGTLAGGIAHDFNNLLQAISGCAALALQEAPEESRTRSLIGNIGKATDRASELVKRLLTFSRWERPEKRPLDLNREISHTVSLLERIIPKMVRIETRLDKDLRRIDGDPTQIEQIIMNLGANARDAMPEGGCLLFETGNATVTAGIGQPCAEMDPGEYVVLRVKDSGVGMSPENLNRIFDPFFTTKEVGAGTGLGLSTVYGIVRGHGGWIRCESRPGNGTCFEIFLPSLPSSHALPDGNDPPFPESDIPGGKETILVVDDEDMVRDLAKIILEVSGYTVLCARSGENAMEMFLAEDGEPDLVILDLGMPGMGGRKCLAEMRKRKPGVKVLVASGYSEERQAAGIIEAGASGFIGKPYKPSDLARTVRSILDGVPA
ncbi:MAG: response regulator [Deltaproteobacteria bacterium]|nr:response regulator [Deltaproteobacteria bacterium]